VRSRFSGSSGQGEDFRPFLSALQALGFAQKSEDTSNSHFVTFELQKTDAGKAEHWVQTWPKLKPCTYKKR
jgi:ribosomal RNA-processing protein 8